jgi:O-antigen/teichoic acid export membrane protein
VTFGDIVKSGSKTVGGVLVAALFTAAYYKVVAIVGGPPAVGYLSLLNQIVVTAVTFATFGGVSALVQALSASPENLRARMARSIAAALAVLTLVVVSVLMTSTGFLSKWLFENRTSDVWPVHLLVMPVVLTVIATYYAAILNASRALGRLAVTQVLGTAATAVAAYPLANAFDAGNKASFAVLLSIAPAVRIVYGAIVARQLRWLGANREGALREGLRLFLPLASATLISGIAATGGLLFVKSAVARHLGVPAAGHFEAGWTLSMTYVSLVLLSFTTYYLPSLSSLSDSASRAVLLGRVHDLTLMIALPVIVLVVCLRPLLITLLYSREFDDALRMMRWMLAGDFFKIMSLVFAVPAMAAGDARVIIFTEIAWQSAFAAISYGAIVWTNSIEYVGLAFLLCYAGYFLYYIRDASARGLVNDRPKVVRSTVIGAVTVMLSLAITWNASHVPLVPLFTLPALSVLSAWMLIGGASRTELLDSARSFLGLRGAGR